MILISHFRDHFADAFFPRLSEWWAAGMLLALGWMLDANPELMATAKTQAYQLMLMIASQNTWAMILKGFATARLLVLLVNGAWRRSPHLRAFSAFLSLFFWTQIALSFASTFGFAFIFSSGALILDLCNSIRAARDARIVDVRNTMARGQAAGGQD